MIKKMALGSKAEQKATLDDGAWTFNVVTSIGIIIVNKALTATHGFNFGKNRLSQLATFSVEYLVEHPFICMNSIRTLEVHKWIFFLYVRTVSQCNSSSLFYLFSDIYSASFGDSFMYL
jgi:hypothetical protein